MGVGVATTVLGTTTVAAAGASAPVDLGSRATGRFVLTVSAPASSLTVDVETATDPGASDWTTAGSFAVPAAAGAADLELVGLEQYVRLRWDIDAETATFACAARIVTAYATRAHLTALGVQAEAIRKVHDDDVRLALLAGSREVDRHLWLRDVPLREAEVTHDVTLWTCRIAAFELLSVRGFDASSEHATLAIERRYRTTMETLAALDGGRRMAPFATGPATTDTIQIATSPRRGWGRARA